MRKNIKLSAVALLVVLLTSMLSVASMAASLLPKTILDLLNITGPGGICATQYINSRVQLAFTIILGGIILISVVYIIMATYKYVTSKGEPGQIESANKSIKAVFMGIAAMVIGMIGIIVVYAVVGAKPTNPELYQTCVNFPQSKGCKDCIETNGTGPDCKTCEDAYEAICSSEQANEEGVFHSDIAELFSTVPDAGGQTTVDLCTTSTSVQTGRGSGTSGARNTGGSEGNRVTNV